ncbi:sigma-70 family RNA polymerase sigma factor [Actinomadura fulvescens]|uniref:sigma-70 family RNA polymerase sigma factor n=1 Tax=Actinomadura fulvescens TaxID=46160 RepID=UPI0031D6E195
MLLERVSFMDDQAREFFVNMRPRLVGSLTMIHGDQYVAEEIAQEAFARVWSHWGKVRGLDGGAAAAWTFRVAINLGRSRVRRRIAERKALARTGSFAAHSHVDPDAADAVAVRGAVAALPVRQRTALALRYYADLPVAEVAELMGCAPGTVKALTSQAIAGLRKQLDVTEEARDGS